VNEATTGFEQETDVLVVGSGAGGLVAALTAAAQGLDVLVVEKAAEYGGSTSLSGGGPASVTTPRRSSIICRQLHPASHAFATSATSRRSQR
jgi:succinate dehydrogenase/fumarate reductase flavoprotein subunit